MHTIDLRRPQAVAASSLQKADDDRAVGRAPLPPPEQCDVLVTGVVRDCGARLRHTIDRLRVATALFREAHFYIVESDSDDDTVDQLRTIERTVPRFAWRTLGRLRTTMPERTQRIAHARNACVEALNATPAYAGAALVLVVDLDDANPLLSAAALRSCWLRDDWDVCCANQRGPYYDVWALRHPLWCPNDWWRLHRFLRQQGIAEKAARDAAMSSRMITIPEDAEWIAVESAFGGAALYRREALAGAHYTGLDVDGEPICEHVPMHAALVARGFRIFVNPQLVNAGYTPHSDHLSPVHRLRRRARNGLRRVLRAAARQATRR